MKFLWFLHLNSRDYNLYYERFGYLKTFTTKSTLQQMLSLHPSEMTMSSIFPSINDLKHRQASLTRVGFNQTPGSSCSLLLKSECQNQLYMEEDWTGGVLCVCFQMPGISHPKLSIVPAVSMTEIHSFGFVICHLKMIL